MQCFRGYPITDFDGGDIRREFRTVGCYAATQTRLAERSAEGQLEQPAKAGEHRPELVCSGRLDSPRLLHGVRAICTDTLSDPSTTCIWMQPLIRVYRGSMLE